MIKKSLFVPAFLLFLLNFVSAQFYSGFTDFLSAIDPNAMTLGVLFIVIFALLFFSLSRIFKDKNGYPNKTIASVVALALSVLSIYWINRTDFDITGLFYSIGISEEILFIVAPLVLLAGLIFLFTRFKTKRFAKTLFIIGGLLLVLSFTDLIYEKGFLMITSIVMIIIGLILLVRKGEFRKRKNQWGLSGLGTKPRPKSDYGLSRDQLRGKGDYKKSDYGFSLSNLKGDEDVRARKRVRRAERKDRRDQRLIERDENQQQRGREAIEESKKYIQEEAEKKALEKGQRQNERMAGKRQKIIQQLQILGAQKERELQKQEMMAAKGVASAEQKVRTLRAEIEKIARRMQRYSS